MNLTIQTGVGVGPIRFGMTRSETRMLLPIAPETFRRTDEDVSDIDEYADLGVYVEFDEQDRCIAVEMFEPADPVLQGMHLLKTPFATIREWLRKNDPNLEKEEGGVYSSLLGVGLAADIPKRDTRSFAESAIAFAAGYYD